MKLLALDTATEACSASLLIDDQLHSRFELTPRAHAQMILPMIDDLLDEAGISRTELDVLAFGRGPGSFTGVRVVASVAQGIAFGLSIPVIPVSTLSALALQAARDHGASQVLVAIDARMKEVYWGEYSISEDLPVLIGAECVIAPGAVPLPAGAGYIGIGSGWSAYSSPLEERLDNRVAKVIPRALPRAEEIALLAQASYLAGKFEEAAKAQPVYLRNNVAKKKGEQ
jgi:tRNA threonylcarbamoyladenosine biosynthesis protein TsaB